MEEILLRKLIEKNYFKVSTEVDARARGHGIDGLCQHQFSQTYTVTGLFESKRDGAVVMGLMSAEDGSTIKVRADAITMIDGMTPERFAENYMIAPDGSDIKVTGKRRGRRPKGWVAPLED